MLKNIKKYLKLKFYAIKILSSKYYIKYIYKQLKKFSIISKFLIINSFKIFNGCRLRKVRRKKRLKFRIFR